MLAIFPMLHKILAPLFMPYSLLLLPPPPPSPHWWPLVLCICESVVFSVVVTVMILLYFLDSRNDPFLGQQSRRWEDGRAFLLADSSQKGESPGP